MPRQGKQPERLGRLSTPSGSIAYTREGKGPPLLLIHGLGGSRHTWNNVLPALSRTSTVIAPDLPGHGDSDPPQGDYSPGAQASALRDLVLGLGFDSINVAGHSLGGGIAMQFAYQFPERTQRLVLISSGGLGAEVTPLLRAATLPGAETVVSALALAPRALSRTALEVLSLGPNLVAREDAAPIAEALESMGSERQRRTFVRTARTVLDLHGQAVSATGIYAALSDIPMLVAWGASDRTIPPEHHRTMATHLPNARTYEIPRAGHYPQETSPVALADAMVLFLRSVPPFAYDEEVWRSRVVQGIPVDGPC